MVTTQQTQQTKTTTLSSHLRGEAPIGLFTQKSSSLTQKSAGRFTARLPHKFPSHNNIIRNTMAEETRGICVRDHPERAAPAGRNEGDGTSDSKIWIVLPGPVFENQEEED